MKSKRLFVIRECANKKPNAPQLKYTGRGKKRQAVIVATVTAHNSRQARKAVSKLKGIPMNELAPGVVIS